MGRRDLSRPRCDGEEEEKRNLSGPRCDGEEKEKRDLSGPRYAGTMRGEERSTLDRCMPVQEERREVCTRHASSLFSFEEFSTVHASPDPSLSSLI